jgi:outer membrane protein
MNVRKTALAILAALALVAAAASAGDLLTRDAARSLAVSHSPTLQRALLSVDSALLAEKAQKYGLLPSVSASAGGDLSYPRSSLAAALGGSVGLSVKQTLYDGTLPVLLAIDTLDTKIAREQARAEYFGVLEAADTAFTGVVDALASMEAATSDWNAARTRQDLAEAKREAGIIARPELLKAESETAAAETSMTQARGKLSTAFAKLASLTGLALPFSVDTSDPTVTDGLTERLAALTEGQTAALIARVQETVVANNPSLSQAALSEQRAAKNRDLAGAKGFPSVGASLSNQVSFAPAGVSTGGSLSLNVSVPLNFWAVKTSVEAGETALRQAGLDTQEAQRTTRLDAQSAVYDLVSAARTVTSSKKALEYAQSHYEAVLEQYRLSTVSSADLSDASALVSTSRSQSISARSQLLVSLTSLRTLAAAESDSVITGLIP